MDWCRERERERERGSRMGSDNKPGEGNGRKMTESRQTGARSSGGGESVVAATRRIVKTHPKKVTTLVLWILGIFCMLFAPAPMKITPEMQMRYVAHKIISAFALFSWPLCLFMTES